jgi:predicted ATPase
MDRTQLADGLADLVDKGLFEWRPSGRRINIYRFSHALLRDAAYASILEFRRRDLHKGIAEILSQEPTREAEQSPEILAGHFTAANDQKGAFIWWSKAGWRAVRLSAPHRAIAYFRQALASLERDPAAGTAAEVAEVLRALGVQLAAVHGNAARDVIETFERCFDLSRNLPGPVAFDAMWMLHSCHVARGDVAKAISIGDRLIATVERDGSEDQSMRAHFMQGLAKLLGGQLEEAFTHHRIVLGIYDETRHADLRFQHASDQGALVHAHLAWGEAIALAPDSSERHAELALELASRLQHPQTSAQVICVLAARAQTLGDRQNASALAFAGKALSERYEFPYWVAWADIILGWAQADRAKNGLAAIDRAIKAYLRTGAAQAIPYAMLLYGDAALELGLPRKALSAFYEGWQALQQHGLALYAAELLRMRARAEIQLGLDYEQVTATLGWARDVARGQKAQLFYHRAAALLEEVSDHNNFTNLALAL